MYTDLVRLRLRLRIPPATLMFGDVYITLLLCNIVSFK